jgi:outer membrane lipoprotein LolB
MLCFERASCIAAIVALAGCASLAPPQAPSNQAASLVPRTPAAVFTAAGRVAARVTGETSRGFSGGFSWSHRPGEDTIELLTPLGQLAARMVVTQAGATIELADGRTTKTSDPDGFLAENLGVPLPLAALPAWLQAVPQADVPYRAEADALGRPAAIWQRGWEVRYTEYASEAVSANPTRLTLSQDGAEARMIVSQWTPQP